MDEMRNLPDDLVERLGRSQRFEWQLSEVIYRVAGPVFLVMGAAFFVADVF